MGYWADGMIRLKPISEALARWKGDWRRLPYDLMPLVNHPSGRDLVAQVMSWTAPKTPSFKPSLDAKKLDAELRSQGFSLAVPSLEPSKLAELISYFKSCLCTDIYRPQLGSFSYDKPPSEETNIGYYSLEDILAAPHVLDLLNDPLMLESAELYLGCKPFIDNLGAWWSYGGRPQAKGTQRYHRDLDSYRGFKQFIYLTDVGPEGGPHKYMTGSHNSPKLNAGRAHSDEELYEAFGRDKEYSMTGVAGTRFVADTYGFHKGCLPEKDSRLVLIAQYNVNRTPHGPKEPLKTLNLDKTRYDAYVNSLLIKA